jgi:D-xylose transport system substrate-binding protein
LLKSKAVLAATAVAAVGVAVGGGASALASTSHRATAHATAGISLSELSSSNFNAMKQLKSIAAKGSGKIFAILPDTTSSLRWADFDSPDLKKAALAAGIPSSDIVVQNAGGSDTTFFTDAQEDITNGAKVLLTTPEDSGTGAKVEKYAASKHVTVIDYDRLTLGGSRPYYVSFNNVKVGTLIGQGFVSCVNAWHVAKPQVIVMHGAPTDNNATLFYEGYNAVLAPYFSSGKYVNVSPPYLVGNWTPTQMLTEFQAAYTAHPTANSMVNPNDETAQPIINYLVNKGIAPDTFPATGQDATLPALQAILAGYQCGTVYKPIGLEAQASIALAVYIRAGLKPPSSLVNGTTADLDEHNKAVPSALLSPEWVTAANLKSTVIKDNFVPQSQICSGTFDGKVNMATACSKDGI